MLAHPWREVEIALTAERDYANSYTDVDVWAEFVHDNGDVLRRPAFWDGGRTWKIRFASPAAEGRWTWCSFCSVEDDGLAGQTGEVVCAAGPDTAQPLLPARLLAHVAGRAQPRARRRQAGSAGRGHALGAALAGDGGAVPCVCRGPAGQGLQRRAIDDRAAGHASRAVHATAVPMKALTWASRTCRTGVSTC